MKFTIKGADYSASPLPKDQDLLAGFPLDDLIGLYLLQDGALNATVAGPYTNSVPGQPDATLYGNFVAPTKRAWGLEVVDLNGFAADTGLAAGRTKQTVIVGARLIDAAATTDAGVTSLAHHLFGHTAGINTDSAGVHSLTGTAFGFHVPNNNVYQRDVNSSISNVTRDYINGSAAKGVDKVIARRVDGPGGSVEVRSLDAANKIVRTNTSNGDTRITTFFDGDLTGNFAIGAWGGSNVRPTVGPTIRLYAFAIYDEALSDDTLDDAMNAMRTTMQARGLTVPSL